MTHPWSVNVRDLVNTELTYANHQGFVDEPVCEHRDEKPLK